MKLLCRRDGLLPALQLASAVVTTRDIKPVLRNIKATVTADRCTLQATDLELGLRLELNGAAVEEPGKILLPAARTLAIIRETPDEELTVEAKNGTCRLRGRSAEFELSTEAPEKFPDVPTFSADKYHEIQAGSLREMIRRTLFAVATENTRYALTGILWELQGEAASLVGTDGRRLAIAQGTASAHGDHTANGQRYIVPAKAMHLLERNLHNPDEPVLVNLTANEAIFKTERLTIHTRLVEGRYPRYRDIIPKKPNTTVPLVAGPFLTALRQAAIMADEESRKVSLHFTKQQLTLQAVGADTSRSKVELPIDYNGKPVEIAFDPRLLTEMLRVLPPESPITLEMTDAKTPAMFRCGDDFNYVVVPLV